MTGRILRKTIFLKAPRELVWDYLTKPAQLEKWFHPPKTAMRSGETLEMFGATSGDLLIWGRIREARAPEYLEYTFTVKPMGESESVVKWWLKAVPGGTELSLEHSGLSGAEADFGLTLSLDKGWDGHFSQLRAALHPAE